MNCINAQVLEIGKNIKLLKIRKLKNFRTSPVLCSGTLHGRCNEEMKDHKDRKSEKT